MKLSKKTLAILAGLTMAMSGSAFAASADDFTDVPKDHWAYQALDYLAQEGVIEGMGDTTFQGGRSMSRYEMAAIVAKAMQKNPTNIGDQAVLEKLQGEFGTEIKRLTKRVDAHDKAIKDLQAKTDKFKIWGMARVQAGDDNGLKRENGSDATSGWRTQYNGDYNNRFYMDLEGQMQVNNHAVARFTVEKNARYRDGEYILSTTTDAKNRTAWPKNVTPAFGVPISGSQRDLPMNDENHSGLVSNVWLELQLGPKHDWYTNVGRKWNGIGMQNLLLGGQVDGIQTYHPIEKGHGWWVSAQYWKSSADCTDYDLEEVKNSTTVTVGTETTTVKLPSTYKITNVYARRAPINATLDFWGPLGKYIDANVGYTRIVGHKYQGGDHHNGYWYDTSGFWNADLKVKLFKDFAVTGSYVKAETNATGNFGHGDRDLAVRFDYRGTDLNKKGSWGLYAKWMNLGAFADLGHDDEWGTREATYTNGIRGWYFGFKCVPAQNIEWETLWAPQLKEQITYNTPQNRHILRSWLDFHF